VRGFGLAAILFCVHAVARPVASLNAGLGEPPESVDRDSPSATVQGFLSAAHAGHYLLAAHYLWLNHLPKSSQAMEGARLARRLRYVIDRKLYIDFSREPSADSPARLDELGTLPLGNTNQPIRLIRVDLGGDHHAWVFSEDTVRAIDRLYEEYGPPFGERLPEFLINTQVFALELWQWLGLILIVLGSTLVSLVIARLALAVGRKASQLTTLKTHFKWGEILGTSAKGPLRLLLWALTFVAATRLLLLPPKVQGSIDVLGKSLSIVTAAWFLLRALGRAADRFLELAAGGEPEGPRARSARTQLAILRRVFAITIYLLTGALLLLQFEVVRHIGVSILASAGIAGLVVGLAAQRPLSALLAGVQLSVSQPIRIGDMVVVEGEIGTIEEIRLTHVVVKIWDLRRLMLPITYFLDRPFQNWSRGPPQILGAATLVVDFSCDVDAVRAELKRVLESEGGSLWDGEVQNLMVTDASSVGMTLRILVSASDSGKNFDLRCLLRERLLAFVSSHPQWLPVARAENRDAPPM
jgi:small-conductance mechanosensitive channel